MTRLDPTSATSTTTTPTAPAATAPPSPRRRPSALRRTAGSLVAVAVMGSGLALGNLATAPGASAAAAASPATADEKCLGDCTPRDVAMLVAYNSEFRERDWPDLRRGDRSIKVAMTQRLLNDQHRTGLAVDGIYGPLTVRAVRSFQRHEGLRASGRMNDRTFERLVPLVTRGDRGLEVATVQRRLGQLGHPLAIDGIAGPRTAAAVRAFQSERPMPRDGIVGPKTWFALFWG